MKYYQRIRDLREDHDLKQQDIAEVLKIERSYYGKYERGIRPLPIEHLIALCRYYNVSADYILCFTDEPKPLPRKQKKKKPRRIGEAATLFGEIAIKIFWLIIYFVYVTLLFCAYRPIALYTLTVSISILPLQILANIRA